MLKSVLLTLCFFTSLFAGAQTFTIKGALQDESDKKPVRSATIRLVAQNDSTVNYNAVTDNLGTFIFSDLQPRIYLLHISSVGYDSLRQTVILTDSSKDMGKIVLYKNAKTLEGVVVTAVQPPVKQKADTLEYSASAFKVNPDALAEDMIKKMPGVTVDASGSVTAQGETVKKITIDGRDFFGDDATAALRNLPADVIDKIQVFDRMSDQAQFTGFDDGNSAKSINIVTKADMRNGQFGRVYAGYGSDDRYSVGGNMSFFKDARRISLVALFNNINQQNFGSQDLLGVTTSSGGGGGGGFRGRGGGGGGRGGGGGMGGWGQNNNFTVGQQSGISKTNAAGINFSDLWAKKVEVTGSYFFNNSGNTNDQKTTQTYTNSKTGEAYRDSSFSTSDNYNHRMNMKIEYKIDSFNSLILTPNLSFQSNNSISNTGSFSDIEGVNSTASSLVDQKKKGYNLRNDLLFRHAFRKKGRSFSINFNTGLNRNKGDIYVNSLSSYSGIGTPVVKDTLNQYRDQLTNGYTLGGTISYTEPVGKMGQVELSYNPTFNSNKANQFTYDYDDIGKDYSFLNTKLSNKFDNTVTTQRTGLSYRKGNRENMISFGVSYQYSELSSGQVYPQTSNINKTFNNLLPNAMINKKLSLKSSIRLFYRSSTNAPSITQLQNIYNNSNPLQWTTGNPELKQQFTNLLGTRYSYTNVSKGNSFFANFFAQKVDNYISNALYRARADSFEIDFPDTLRRGAQLSKPVNLNGYWNFRSFFTYGLPVKLIKSNLNLNAGYTYSRLPGQVEDTITISNTHNFNLGAVLASNISQYIDFNLSYTANFNSVKYSAESSGQNTHYFSHVAGIQANVLSKSGWLLQNDLNNQFYKGLSAGYNQNFWLWNAGVGKKFMKEQKAEIKLTVFDLLKQNQSIVRTVNENYIEDVQNRVLQQYFLLTFTYKLKNFGKKKENGNSRFSGDGPGSMGPGQGGFQRPPGGF